MELKFDQSVKMKSAFIAETYFPAIINFSTEELNNHFIEFSYKNTDMFEISVHSETRIIKRFTFTLCNHFTVIKNDIPIPNYIDGTIMIEGPDKVDCDSFMANLYNNGLLIKLSAQETKVNYKSGNLIFAIGNNNKLTEVYLINLIEKEVKHIKKELYLGME